MTHLAEILFALAFALPISVSDRDEDPNARSARLETIAVAIDRVARHAACEDASPHCTPIWEGSAQELGVLLLAQAWWESRLARNVHAGECREYECDARKDPKTGRVIHRARSLWQLHATGPLSVREWRLTAGTDLDATERAAWAAARLLGRYRAGCGSIEGALSHYATGRRCEWNGAARRVAFYRKLLDRSRVEQVD